MTDKFTVRLTREQAAIVGAFTGIACGPFSDIHKTVERVLGCPVLTHEMARKALWDEVKEKIKPEFLAICYQEPEKKHD